MNRQQAINYLLSSGFSEEQINTIEQAFKQEPTNDLGVDLISREQAKTAIRDKFKDLPSRVEINTILNELPSVTPQEPCDKCEVGNPCLYCKHEFEAKTGHWIALENRFELGDRVKCSECGQVFVVGDDVSRHYCPNCGAKMVEPQESEE